MQINEFDNISISGQFDLIFKEKCPPHPAINWQLMKSLAFNLSELHPYVDGGLFRIPKRLYVEYDGKDPYDPADNVATMRKILQDWWERLLLVPEEDRIYFIILAFKIKMYNVEYLQTIAQSFEGLFQFFSPGLMLEVKKIVEYLKVM
jgi:hypothetical protein